MFRYLFILVMSFNILFSNDNVVKTTELELFLFKVGFESLLKDVSITKDKSSLNSDEIEKINEKIELIMSELYKDKRVLLNDSNENQTFNINQNELNNLKNEIAFLKDEVNKLKEKKETKVKVLTTKKEKEKEKTNKMRVVSNIANIYDNPFSEANIVKKQKRDDLVDIEYCDKFGWCKIANNKYYVKKYLLKK
ncbi:hypothetical protein [Arcobacter sp. LA11]|uniref:hypothetical protein n=1 Tax=Arcobacter sp. LA11 TaxID=1898176 RepID=UPI0009344C69|nr:hypothetical protein [Arcobacter sp. LA11]